MAGLTESIARFVAETHAGDFPPDAIEKAKLVVADTFACIVAGAGSETAEPLARYVERAGARGDKRVLGTHLLTSAELAAMVNGTFGHSLDFDDVLTMMPGHPSAIIVSAALSEAGPITGKRFLEAYVIGIEAGAKIGLGITNGHYNRGFHSTGTLGIFSATAALAKLAGLDVEGVRTTIGIAASMSSGLRRNFGTMTKPLHAGWAARNAVAAVELARCELSAAPDVLEAKAGFFAAYGAERSNAEAPLGKLGRPYVVVDPGITLKRWPCYNGSQRAMHALLQVRQTLGFNADTLERLECRMPPGGLHALIYDVATTGLEGKFCLPYQLAAGVLDGEYSFASFTDEAVARPAIKALMERIHVKEDPRCGGEDAASLARPAGERGFVEVEARMTDGRSDLARVTVTPGHATQPLGWDEIHRKFRDCAEYARLDAGRAERAFDILTRLEDCSDVDAVVELLTPA